MSSQDHEREFFGEMRAQILGTPLPVGRRFAALGGVAGRPWRRLELPLAGLAAALVAVVAVLTLALGTGGGPSPAYAVTLDRGTGVTIYLREFRDIRELNLRLAALPSRIRAVPVIRGCVDPVHYVIGAYHGVPAHIAPGPARTLVALPPQRGIVIISETIENDTLPGRTLIIPITRSGRQAGIASPQGTVVIGSAPRCVDETTAQPRH